MTKDELKVVTPLHATHDNPQVEIAQLQAEIAQHQAENKNLQAENAQLKEHIRKMASDPDPGGPHVVAPSPSFD